MRFDSLAGTTPRVDLSKVVLHKQGLPIHEIAKEVTRSSLTVNTVAPRTVAKSVCTQAATCPWPIGKRSGPRSSARRRTRPSLKRGASIILHDVTALFDDLEEIRNLLARYCFAIDTRDADAWADLFTEDGVFHYSVGEPISGKGALRNFISLVPDDRHHLTMNEIIEIDGDTATVRAYALVTKESPPVISAVGDYKDTISRTSDGWRFSSRIYSPH
jgi:uncharacterized protein (TIGR02246 family)